MYCVLELAIEITLPGESREGCSPLLGVVMRGGAQVELLCAFTCPLAMKEIFFTIMMVRKSVSWSNG